MPLAPSIDTLGPLCSTAADLLLLTSALGRTSGQPESHEGSGALGGSAALDGPTPAELCARGWRCGVMAPDQRDGIQHEQLRAYDAACEALVRT